MKGYALVLNAGSSSLKFSVYERAESQGWHLDAQGQVEGIGATPRLTVRDAAGAGLAKEDLGSEVGDGPSALAVVAQWLQQRYQGGRVLGVGHRVVHGGAAFPGPVIVTRAVLDTLRGLIPLAPLHQPHNVAAIDAVARQLPGVPQVACFDTSFHRGQPAVAQLVPLPREVREAGVQRYGFHGLSYEYIASALPQVAPDVAEGRVIVAHLGSGASLCALRGRRSVANTFGFTPLDGLCMGTRPGSVDPGVILHLFQTLEMSVPEVEDMLYRKSGLLGISGVSNDMRALLESAEPDAHLAVDYFVYRIAQEVGALAAALGGLDALVFTAGIGENSAEVRRRVVEACGWLGFDLDHHANDCHEPCISAPSSRAPVWVIPTNEELMIARHTGQLLDLTAA